MNDRVDEPMVWFDVETTGLETNAALLEIGVMVTDGDLFPLGEPYSVVLPARERRLRAMVPVVQQMHQASGLWQECLESRTTMAEAHERIMEYVTAWVQPQAAPMCGSNIRFDRALIARDLPAVDAYLHYRIIDVSGIKEVVRRWLPSVYAQLPVGRRTHRAMADIGDSIAELSYYRHAAFREPEAKAIAS